MCLNEQHHHTVVTVYLVDLKMRKSRINYLGKEMHYYWCKLFKVIKMDENCVPLPTEEVLQNEHFRASSQDEKKRKKKSLLHHQNLCTWCQVLENI